MNTQSTTNPAMKTIDLLKGIFVRFGEIAVMFVVLALVLFLSSNDLRWTWAWVYLGINLASVCTNAVFLLSIHPETAVERGRPKEMKNWDKVVVGFWSLFQFLGIPLVAGLDVRFGLSGTFPPALQIAGAITFAAGMGLLGWAMITNAYFSTAARIQDDRGQTVCRSGPYRIVRHPGYLGTLIQSIGTPLLLGSIWAFLPGVLGIVCMIIRTTLEDRMLQTELPGYPEFSREVRYRLVPGIW
jgi:protein-S-isoprenylcysteine O-methyltransferase Ste14